MRWLIASVAFIVPILLLTHIGMTSIEPGRGPAIGAAGMSELRSWFAAKREIVERYAPRPGQAEILAMPHLALERFERAGCDPQGSPWFRLADRPHGVRCGILRRASPGRTVAPDGRTPELLLRLAGEWLYWEWSESAPDPAGRPPSAP